MAGESYDMLERRAKTLFALGLLFIGMCACVPTDVRSEPVIDQNTMLDDVEHKQQEQIDTLKWMAESFSKNGFNAEGIGEDVKGASVGFLTSDGTYGSGTFVKYDNHNILLTAWHVLDGSLDHKGREWNLRQLNGDPIPMKVVDIEKDATKDIAFVAFVENGDSKITPIDFVDISFSFPNSEGAWSGIFFPSAADGRAIPISPPVSLNVDNQNNPMVYERTFLGIDYLSGHGGSGAGLYRDGKLAGVLLGKQHLEADTPLNQQKRSYLYAFNSSDKSDFEKMLKRLSR